ncbi:MAG: alpha/beta fold hydrolase [Halioglobus sp.]|nr:alpha/beta fold hydrolase [Halioglobus sp.]
MTEQQLTAANTTLKRIRVNGIELNVMLAGESNRGPTVLLVHGFPDDNAVWRKQIAPLVAAGYRVIAPDTRGCGDSEISPREKDYQVDNLVADLVGLLDALDIDRVRLVAHDWGAIIGWRFVLAHPERTERYVALSVGHPNAYGQGGISQKLRGYYIVVLQLRGIIEFLVTRFNWLGFRAMTRFPGEFPRWKASLSRPGRLTAGMNYYRANPGMMFTRGLPAAQVPVFGIWSSGDGFLTEDQMRESQRYVNGPWRYSRIEGGNHWMQLDAADKLNPLLLDFLQ